MLTKQNLSLRLPSRASNIISGPLRGAGDIAVNAGEACFQRVCLSWAVCVRQTHSGRRLLLETPCPWPIVLLKWRHPLHPYKQLGGAVGEGLCWLKCVGMTWIFFAVTLLFVSNCSRPSSRPPPLTSVPSHEHAQPYPSGDSRAGID